MRHISPILAASLALLGPMHGANRAQPKLVSPRVIDEPVWSYPLAAERAAVRQGEARALVSISDEGELLDFLVVGCTHYAFAEAVAQALPSYRFTPAKLRGEPTTVRMPLAFHFKQEGMVTSLLPTEQWDAQLSRLSRDQENFTSWICPESRLDRPLTPVSMGSPHYPGEMRERREPGTVTVDFFVDGEGKVRLPAVEPGAHPSFTREAVGALTTWRFEPPTSNGQPVIVRVSQTFNFVPPAETARVPERNAAPTAR